MTRWVWKVRPEPQLQVRARLLGSYEFVCPDCGKLSVISYPNFRTGRVKCTRRKACAHAFQAGLLFSADPWDSGTCYARNEVHDPRVANAMAPLSGTWKNVVGHIMGPVEWWCPECEARSQDVPLWDDGTLVCPTGHIWYACLLISRPESGFNAITPYDWIPPYVPEPVGAAAPPQAPGSDRDRAGDTREAAAEGLARPAGSDR